MISGSSFELLLRIISYTSRDYWGIILNSSRWFRGGFGAGLGWVFIYFRMVWDGFGVWFCDLGVVFGMVLVVVFGVILGTVRGGFLMVLWWFGGVVWWFLGWFGWWFLWF